MAGAGPRDRRRRSSSSADYICFTGSTATGRLIAPQCADRLIGCSLELGGKNPMLVLRDADLEKAAEGAVRGAFPNAGQLCVSMERMFVADQVYDRFVERFVARTQAMTLGASLEWGVDMGTLIYQRQLDTVRAHVEDAVAKGARVLTGGRARPDLAPFFFEPTILEGVSPDMTCFGQETFGPVISLYRFHDEADAIARANEGSYGLNASIYSQDGAPRPGGRPPDQAAARSTSTRPYGAAFGSHRRPDGRDAGVRAWAAARARRASSATPRRSRWRTQRRLALAPMLGLSEETYARLMTASLRLLKKLRPRLMHPLRRPGHRLRLRRLGHGAAADREGLPGRRARGGRPLRGRRPARERRRAQQVPLPRPSSGCYGIQRIDLLNDCFILAGAGVGGGSLVYANTLYEPPEPFYRDPQWAHITDWKAELAPYYDQAKRMLGVVGLPPRPPRRTR